MKHYGDDELNETDLGMARFSQALISDENQISKEEKFEEFILLFYLSYIRISNYSA